MRHFDLFSGYGGFSLALQKVSGLLSESESGQARTIGFSEIDKYANGVVVNVVEELLKNSLSTASY